MGSGSESDGEGAAAEAAGVPARAPDGDHVEAGEEDGTRSVRTRRRGMQCGCA